MIIPGRTVTPPKRSTVTLPKQSTAAPPKQSAAAPPKQSGRHARPPSTGDTSISGSAAASVLACGIGCALFGIAVVAAETSEAVKTAFTLSQGVGPLSGKALIGSLAYFGGWLGLHRALRGRTVRTRTTMLVAGALVGISLLLTFPPVYQLWAAE